MKYHSIIIFFICVISFIAGYFTGSARYGEKFSENIIVRDTIVKTVPREPLIITKIRPEIRYKYDTIIRVKPFTAIADTIVKYDTIFAKYDFPEHLFSFNIKTKEDTFRIPKIIQYKEKKEEWWENHYFSFQEVL